MKGTRIINSKGLHQSKFDALTEQAQLLGEVRSEVWRRYGSIKGVGVNHRNIRKEWVKSRDFSPLPAKAWKEILRDALEDIRLYEEACKKEVRKKISARFKDNDTRKNYYQMLKYNDWVDDPLLCRWMRKVKKHGKNHTHNQIILEAGVYDQFKGKDGNTWLKVPSLVRRKMIAVPLNSKITLKGSLRVIIKDAFVEVHYFANGRPVKKCGNKTLGLDKGYTEVFADSEGSFYGTGFNKMLTKASDARSEKNKHRNKLYQIAEKSRPDKKDRVYKNNLGTKKRVKQNKLIKQQIRTHCFKAVHAVVNKARTIVVEDLTSPIRKRDDRNKRNNRLMNQWMKGSITEALETVTKARGSSLRYVCSAYTSQMDSNTHLLQGRRVGDRFYHENGDVSQADTNAARNILHRSEDGQIKRYTPYLTVRKILLNRFRASKELPHASGRPSLQDSSYTPVPV